MVAIVEPLPMTPGDKPPRAPRKGAPRDREFDLELGAKIRRLRIAGGISQKALGDALGLSYQQIQKYEIGADRVTVGTLNLIVSSFGVTLAEFFSDASSMVPPRQMKILAAQRIGARVLALEDPQVLRRVMSLIDTLSKAERSAPKKGLEGREEVE